MALKTSKDWHGCPIRFGSTVLGDGWSMLVLRDLMFFKARYYADFLKSGEGIATNILASRLAALERECIIEKSRDPDHGARFIYALTEKGIELIPIMLEIMDWAEKWDSQTDVPRAFIAELRKDRSALAYRIGSEHRKLTIAKLGASG